MPAVYSWEGSQGAALDAPPGDEIMTRAMVPLMAVTVVLVGAPLTQATSNPVIDVDIFGIELRAQSGSIPAVFAGVFEGRVGSRRSATGTFEVAIHHDPLPEPHDFADITGGSWILCSGEVSSAESWPRELCSTTGTTRLPSTPDWCCSEGEPVNCTSLERLTTTP